MTETAGRPLGGRYRMEALLATGGMGEVWAARDLLLDRAVAVKVLGGAFAGDGRAAERLRREARAAGRLEHPAIARVLDLGEDGGRPYLVMELLEGESLAERIARAGPMDPAEAARVVVAVAGALEAAHRAGVVHRDVKPGNVFLTSDGEVKVLDFGIASAAGDAALTTGDLLGTAAYLAPERALGHEARAAADIYALGVVLYELLAGRRPFETGSDVELAMAHINAEPVPPGPGRPIGTPDPGRRLRAGHGQGPGSPPPVRGRVRPPGGGPGSGSCEGPCHLDSRGHAPLRPRAPVTPALRRWGPIREGNLPGRRGRRALHTPRPRRRSLVVALLVAGAVSAALPALAAGLLPWAGGRVETPFGVRVPGVTLPSSQAPDQAPAGRDVAAGDPDPAEAADPPAGGAPDRGGDDDRDRDDDSGGSGRSGGGGGGGSSGPG